LTIVCDGTTTTTTEAQTTTTTTSGIVCEEWEILNGAFTNVIDYKDCNGNTQQFTLDPGETVNCFSVDSNAWGTDVPFLSTQPFTQNKCTSTTSTSTTTTTTAAPTYIAYPADQYYCDAPNCGAFAQTTEIAFPDTFTPVLNKWYGALTPDGFAYQLTSTTPSAGPGLVCYEQSFNTCGLACSI
jgi:hypothetical protein